MSRLVVVESLKSAVASRHEWDVVLDSAHPERGLDPSVLLEQVGVVAATLAAEAAGAPVFATSMHKLEVLGPVLGGERLIVTAALEAPRDGELPVSLVARRRRGAPGAVVIAAVLRFSVGEARRTSGEVAQTRLIDGGASPMHTTFRAKLRSEDLLLGGNLVPWVHASALVSAQGYAGGPVVLTEVQGLSVLGPVRKDEPLTLSCSVVRASGDKLTVLSVVRSEARDVLCAMSTFRVKHGEVPLLVVG